MLTPFLVYGDVLDNQRAIAVRGTFLQNRSYMEAFLRLVIPMLRWSPVLIFLRYMSLFALDGTHPMS